MENRPYQGLRLEKIMSDIQLTAFIAVMTAIIASGASLCGVLFGSGIAIVGQWLNLHESNKRWAKEKRIEELKAKRQRMGQALQSIAKYSYLLLETEPKSRNINLLSETFQIIQLAVIEFPDLRKHIGEMAISTSRLDPDYDRITSAIAEVTNRMIESIAQIDKRIEEV